MRVRRIAVTGASGFIGRHVLAALAPRKVDIVAATRDAAGLAALEPAIEVIELDLAAGGAGVFDRLGRPDVLLHLAWDSTHDYRSAHQQDSELPRQIAFLEPLVADGLPALVATGTCFEYGMQSGSLAESLPTRPDNPYGRAKDALRRALQSLRERHEFAFCWARLFYLFGDGQPERSLYSQLKNAVACGEPVFNMSGGEQLRDFLPVEDAADALVRLALGRSDAGCVNVCSGRPVRVRALIERWLAENDWSIELNPGHYPYPDYEPMEFWGDRGKLDRLLRGEL